MLKKTVCALSLICFSFAATAAYIDRGTYVTDTNSGYDWLKLTETNTLSYNQVVSSGLLSEWSYVGDTPGVSLYGIPTIELPVFLELYGDLQFPEIVGRAQSYAITGYREFDSGLGFVDWQLDRVRIEADLNPDNPELQIVDETLLFANLDSVEPWTGHALVRVTAVPVPAAIWFFGSALLAVFSLKRKHL